MSNALEKILEEGNRAYQSGHFVRADQLYRSILEKNLTHAEANFRLAKLSVKNRNIETSILFFKTAITADPSKSKYWFSYIEALMQHGRKKDAQRVLSQAFRKGATAKAFKNLEQRLNVGENSLAKSLEPPKNTLQELVNIYSQGQLRRAISKADELLLNYSKSAVVYNIKGAAYAGLGRASEAIDSYEKAIKIRPDFAQA